MKKILFLIACFFALSCHTQAHTPTSAPSYLIDKNNGIKFTLPPFESLSAHEYGIFYSNKAAGKSDLNIDFQRNLLQPSPQQMAQDDDYLDYLSHILKDTQQSFHLPEPTKINLANTTVLETVFKYNNTAQRNDWYLMHKNVCLKFSFFVPNPENLPRETYQTHFESGKQQALEIINSMGFVNDPVVQESLSPNFGWIDQAWGIEVDMPGYGLSVIKADAAENILNLTKNVVNKEFVSLVLTMDEKKSKFNTYSSRVAMIKKNSSQQLINANKKFATLSNGRVVPGVRYEESNDGPRVHTVLFFEHHNKPHMIHLSAPKKYEDQALKDFEVFLKSLKFLRN